MFALLATAQGRAEGRKQLTLENTQSTEVSERALQLLESLITGDVLSISNQKKKSVR